MQKNEIRKIYRQKRQQLSFSQKEKMDDLLLIQFQKLPINVPALIMTYASIENMSEFDPQLITDYCYYKNGDQRLVYPVMSADNCSCDMEAVMVNDDSFFNTNAFGVDEPVGGKKVSTAAIEMVIVPLLSFDKKGNRVGYGKGYYDRFLTDCNNSCIKIGFSYFGPVDTIEDINQYDIPLDYCITPEQIFTF